MDGRAANVHGTERAAGFPLCTLLYLGLGTLLGSPALLSELGEPLRADRVRQGLCLPASSWRWQDFPSVLHNHTSSSAGAFSHPHPAPQTLPTFQTFIKYKTPGLYDRTLHSTYAEKRVRHSNVQKSPVPPSPGELPYAQPHCSQCPVEHQGCWGSQSHGGAQGSCPAWSGPLLPAAPPAPGLEG